MFHISRMKSKNSANSHANIVYETVNRIKRKKWPSSLKIKLAQKQNWKCAMSDCNHVEIDDLRYFQIDHIKSLENGGADAEYNLQLLCLRSHVLKTFWDRRPEQYEQITKKSKYFGPLFDTKPIDNIILKLRSKHL